MWIHLINLASDAWKRFSHDTNCRLNFHCVFLLFNMGASDNAWIKSWPAGGGRKWQWQLLTAVWGCCCLRLTNIFFVGISDKARQHIKKPVTTEKVFSSCGYFSRPGCKYCVTLYFPPNRRHHYPLEDGRASVGKHLPGAPASARHGVLWRDRLSRGPLASGKNEPKLISHLDGYQLSFGI